MGYHVSSEFQGQGLATEAARACLDLAFGELAEPQVIAIIKPANTPSRHVAEKLGMRAQQGSASRGQEVVVYGIGANERATGDDDR